jgi:2-polyprenyl-3-methyl-5-hydroxy-6-metoxy-1,4-benzoquinol methylase
MKLRLKNGSRRMANSPLARRIYPKWSFQMRQTTWNQFWAKEQFSDSWRVTAPPDELVEAVESGWFPPAAKVLDIGCGTGEISAWFASQGFQVLGIDFAQQAVERARARHKDVVGQLTWQVLDICREAPEGGLFDVLIDRGCLHGIPSHMVESYVHHVAACCPPGARFLLVHKTVPLSTDAITTNARATQVSDLIKAHFVPAFEVLQIAPTVLHRSSGADPKEPMAGLAIRLVRRRDERR